MTENNVGQMESEITRNFKSKHETSFYILQEIQKKMNPKPEILKLAENDKNKILAETMNKK